MESAVCIAAKLNAGTIRDFGIMFSHLNLNSMTIGLRQSHGNVDCFTAISGVVTGGVNRPA